MFRLAIGTKALSIVSEPAARVLEANAQTVVDHDAGESFLIRILFRVLCCIKSFGAQFVERPCVE